MRFVELLRATVLLSGGAATTLALLTLVGATNDEDETLALACAGWWAVACAIGTVVGGRPDGVSDAIGRALAGAQSSSTLPELRPAQTLLNRLWPLLLVTVLAGGLAFLVPSVTGIATGFCLIWALAWRFQGPAVQAIEERDGVTFYVDRSSPVAPVKLLRLPGFRREVPVGGLEG